MKKYKKYIIPAVILFFLFLIFVTFYYLRYPLRPKVRINKTEFTIELALSPQEKALGLGQRDSMPQRYGMLFLFDHTGIHPFWMKGMRFPLDFIWIRDDRIVDLTPNVPLLTAGDITRVRPKAEINKVLELNAGEIDRFDLKIGDKVEFLD